MAWPTNVRHLGHVPPSQHPSFFSSSRLTLNVTRGEMAAMGWCPSGRLFEAAACGAAILSDWWPGLEEFFEPGGEILVGHDTSDALASLALDEKEVRLIGSRARQRVLDEHTSAHRARELLELIRASASHVAVEIEAAEG
jgi:spore maturation protein CgeB